MMVNKARDSNSTFTFDFVLRKISYPISTKLRAPQDRPLVTIVKQQWERGRKIVSHNSRSELDQP